MFTLRLFLRVATRSFLSILLLGIIGASICLVVEMFSARYYSATSVVRIRATEEVGDDVHLQYQSSIQNVSLESIITQVSDANQAHLRTWWKDFGPQLKTYFQSTVDSLLPQAVSDKSATIERSLDLVSFSYDEKRSTITTTVRSEKPVLSAQLANAMARELLAETQTQLGEQETSSQNYLQEKLNEANQKVQQAERELSQRSKAYAAWSERENAEDHLATLNNALSNVIEQRIELETAIRDKSTRSARILNSPITDRLRERHINSEFELASLAKVLGPKHPRVQSLRAEQQKIDSIISSESSYSEAQLPTLLAAVQSQEAALRSAIEELRSEQQSLAEQASEYEAAQAELASLKKAQRWLTVQSAYAQTNVGGLASPARITSPARVPRNADKPVDYWFIAGGSVCGLGLGLLLVLIRVLNSRRFFSIEHAEQYLNVQALAAVPEIQSPFSLMSPRPLYARLPDPAEEVKLLPVSAHIADFVPSEHEEDVIYLIPEMIIDGPTMQKNVRPRLVEDAFRRLRGELILNLPKGSGIITVTSSLPGEGKTTVASNLGNSLAKAGYRTLLVDASLHFEPGTQRLVGLSEYLHGLNDLQDIVYQSSTAHLFSVASGNAGPDSSDLLYSRRMGHFINEMKNVFDYIILDAPALLQHSEALLLAETADANIFVIDSEQSDTHLSRQGLDKLKQVHTQLAGIILNRAPHDEGQVLHRAA